MAFTTVAVLQDWPRYRLSIRNDGRNYLVLENKVTGECDHPVIDDLGVRYDRPEAWPQYVRREIRKKAPSHRAACATWRRPEQTV